MDLTNDPDLHAQRLARSGLRTFVLSPVSAAEVTTEQFLKILFAYESYFADMGPGHPPEAFASVHGRRAERAGADTRVIAVSILEFEQLKDS